MICRLISNRSFLIQTHSHPKIFSHQFGTVQKTKSSNAFIPRNVLSPSEVRIKQAVLRNKNETARQIFNEIAKTEQLTETHYKFLLESYVPYKSKGIKEVIKIYERMKSDNILIKQEHLTVILKCCGPDNIDIAMRVFDEIVNTMKVKPNSYNYLCFIQVCVLSSHLDLAIKMFDEMKEKKLIIFKSIYLLIIKALISNYSPKRAIDVTKYLINSKEIKFDSEDIIPFIIASISSQEVRALKYYVELITDKYKAELDEGVLFRCLLLASNSKDTNFVNYIWNLLKRQKIERTTIYYFVYINTFLKARQFKEAFTIINEGIVDNIEFDENMKEKFINFCCMNRTCLYNSFEAILELMNQIDLHISVINIVIAASTKTNNMDIAIKLLEEINKRNIKLNINTFNLLLIGCRNTMDVDTTMSIISEMETNYNIKPNEDSYLYALECTSIANNQVLTEQLIETMTNNGINLNYFHYTTIGVFYARLYQLEKVLNIIDKIIMLECKPTKIFNTLNFLGIDLPSEYIKIRSQYNNESNNIEYEEGVDEEEKEEEEEEEENINKEYK